MRKISIFGSTGSVGENTIKVLQAQEEEFDIQVLTANENVSKLAEQAKLLSPHKVVIANDKYYNELSALLVDTDIEVEAGHDALIDAASVQADWIMAAIVGMAGIEPLVKAIEQGTTVAIANKEPLVAAGPLIMQTAKKHGTTILPIDSEHNAIFQVFEPENKTAIDRIILTASGGPFRTTSMEDLQSVTCEQALNHPNWSMGSKITIDSATMMNKALEVIEAQQLFDVGSNQIEVLVHPQSVVHSMVEYTDGSVLAQMGAADMCTPITNALGYPKRLKTPGERLDLLKMNCLEFEAVDESRFPSIRMAQHCLESGLNACITLNAANEVAVEAFLNHKIAFLDIYKIVADQLANMTEKSVTSLDEILLYDQNVRSSVESAIVSN